MPKLSDFGAGIDRGPHVSLMDVAFAVRVAGIEDPGNPHGIFAWRPFREEVQERVWRTSLYAVREACPDAPMAPEVEPPETDLLFEIRERREAEPTQATLDAIGGGA